MHLHCSLNRQAAPWFQEVSRLRSEWMKLRADIREQALRATQSQRGRFQPRTRRDRSGKLWLNVESGIAHLDAQTLLTAESEPIARGLFVCLKMWSNSGHHQPRANQREKCIPDLRQQRTARRFNQRTRRSLVEGVVGVRSPRVSIQASGFASCRCQLMLRAACLVRPLRQFAGELDQRT